MEHGGCAVLFRSPRSALLGVPNALLGVLLYVILAAGLLLRLPPLWLFLLTLPAVAMSAFLGWSLIRNRLQCRICWTGHIANAALALLLAMRVYAYRRAKRAGLDSRRHAEALARTGLPSAQREATGRSEPPTARASERGPRGAKSAAYRRCRMTIRMTPSGPRTRSRTMSVEAGLEAMVRGEPPPIEPPADI